ncbi:MAG: hypothetical protein R6V55_16745 [Desulfovermiculus sp.]
MMTTISLIENFPAGDEIVGSFDVENIVAETLLFQAGYSTIADFEQIGSVNPFFSCLWRPVIGYELCVIRKKPPQRLE